MNNTERIASVRAREPAVMSTRWEIPATPHTVAIGIEVFAVSRLPWWSAEEHPYHGKPIFGVELTWDDGSSIQSLQGHYAPWATYSPYDGEVPNEVVSMIEATWPRAVRIEVLS